MDTLTAANECKGLFEGWLTGWKVITYPSRRSAMTLAKYDEFEEDFREQPTRLWGQRQLLQYTGNGLAYPCGEVVRPKEGFGPIAVFTDHHAAESFAVVESRYAGYRRYWDAFLIVKVRYQKVTEKKNRLLWMPCPDDYVKARTVYVAGQPVKLVLRDNVPDSTDFASAVICLE